MRGSLTGFTRSNPAVTRQRQARPPHPEGHPEAKLHRLPAAHRSLTETLRRWTAPVRTLQRLDRIARRDLNGNQLDLKSISGAGATRDTAVTGAGRAGQPQSAHGEDGSRVRRCALSRRTQVVAVGDESDDTRSVLPIRPEA